MTNVQEIFDHIAVKGQHPRMLSDTYLLLEQLGHRLDRESERCFAAAEALGLSDRDITEYIERHIDVANVLRESAPVWDGGYVVCGITGSGETFVLRDPWGIRPAFWYKNDEVFALASERPVLQTTFDLEVDDILELQPGQALITSRNGELRIEQILEPKRFAACSFERVYFSRGSDRDIYRERKEMGRRLVPDILKAINYEVDNTVLSYIPNTAESAYYGMIQGFEEYLNEQKTREITSLLAQTEPGCEEETQTRIREILSRGVRAEKVAWKDIKMRTFIAEGNSRNDLAAHVYDITYGSLRPGVDNLVVIDDSIVRGTTLRESIIRILDRLHPKRIVIVSSSPQVRYPDYYGIDMANMDEFIAFKAAIALHEERGTQGFAARQSYNRCKSAGPFAERRDSQLCVRALRTVYRGGNQRQDDRTVASHGCEDRNTSRLPHPRRAAQGLPHESRRLVLQRMLPHPGWQQMRERSVHSLHGTGVIARGFALSLHDN